MNYLWEAVFMADGQGIPRERIRFLAAKDYSAYMEVSHMFLNQDAFDDDCRLEVNPYYRFYDIFKELYQPEMREFLSLRESLTNLIFHVLAGNDILSGMTREEYYKKLLYQDL